MWGEGLPASAYCHWYFIKCLCHCYTVLYNCGEMRIVVNTVYNDIIYIQAASTLQNLLPKSSSPSISNGYPRERIVTIKNLPATRSTPDSVDRANNKQVNFNYHEHEKEVEVPLEQQVETFIRIMKTINLCFSPTAPLLSCSPMPRLFTTWESLETSF